MSSYQNPITTTRLPKEAPPIFDIEDVFHMGSPNPSPDRPSSTRPEPSTSHHEWDLVTARLGPSPPRPPTPDVDLNHPIQAERKTALLDSKPGFFRSDNAYLSHWECCKV